LSGLSKAGIQARISDTQMLPVSKVKDRLNELVDAAAHTRTGGNHQKGVST